LLLGLCDSLWHSWVPSARALYRFASGPRNVYSSNQVHSVTKVAMKREFSAGGVLVRRL